MEKQKYIVVERKNDCAEFQKVVNYFISQGYVPKGEMKIVDNSYTDNYFDSYHGVQQSRRIIAIWYYQDMELKHDN